MVDPSFSTKLITFLSGFSGLTAYSVILGVLFACGLGLPIPEDITLIAAGLLAGLKKISLAGALIAGFVGVLIGDAFLFFIGRKLGYKAFQLPGFRKIFTPQRIQIAEDKVRSNSRFICFTARFLPGLRAPIYLTAGILGVRPIVFFLLDGAAALISVPIWVVGGWYFAGHIDEALEFASQAQMYLIAAVLGFIGLYVVYNKYVRKKPVDSADNTKSSPPSI